VVIAESVEWVETFTQHLWNYREHSFLPHGTISDGEAEHQPIWLTTLDENPNEATVLFLINSAFVEKVERYKERVCKLFNGNDLEAVSAARDHWRLWCTEGYTNLTYWQETQNGAWVKVPKQVSYPATL
jgi:DNA polymerase-3 subunit chi